MITNFQSFINQIDFTSLQEGAKPGLELSEFKNLFQSQLFESQSELVLEQAYTCYEVGLLYENRKSWFQTDTPIYTLNSGSNAILFKDSELFVISKKSLKSLKEGFIDSISAGWEAVKSVAKSSVDAVVSGAGKTWDAISDGAKKAYDFAARIVSAVAEFAKAEPLEAIAIVLQILSGIVAFIPAAGTALGPCLLAGAGALEVIGGVMKSKEAWEKLKDIEINNLAKSKESVSEGAPLIIAGCVSMVLGLNDIITAPKAAIPGAAASSLVLRKSAATWEKTFLSGFAKNTEHFIVHTSGDVAKKMGPKLVKPLGTFMEKGGSALACTLTSILFVNVGKGILGGLFDVFIKALSGIASAFSFVLSLPTKLADALNKVKDAVSSPIAKTVLGGIAGFIQPAVAAVGKFIDKYVKPTVDKISGYLKAVSENSETLSKTESKVEKGETVVKDQMTKIKPKNAEVSKEDLSKIKKLPKLKVQESLLSYNEFTRV
jgi:hypothetical protein